jgi:hypothetical protein
MVCPPATSEAGARWLRFGLVVATTTSRRDNKDQMIRPLVPLRKISRSGSWGARSAPTNKSTIVPQHNPMAREQSKRATTSLKASLQHSWPFVQCSVFLPACKISSFLLFWPSCCCRRRQRGLLRAFFEKKNPQNNFAAGLFGHC